MNHAYDFSAHHQSGRYDNVHGDEDLIDDDTAEQRAAEYAKAIVHCPCESTTLATELLESGALEPLLAISRTDSAYAGTLFAQIVSDLIDRRSQLLSENDSGTLIEFGKARDFQSYEMQFEAAREAVRKRGI